MRLDDPIAALVAIDPSSSAVAVFRGSPAACGEYGLVLEALGISYERLEVDDSWVLSVAPALAAAASAELRRYASERTELRATPVRFVAFRGSGIGAVCYAGILILVAYCAGIHLFGADWLDHGALESAGGVPREWWRAVTALTLHLDQEHLLGNLLFGVGVGMLAGRTLGPGIAWFSILLSGALGNYVNMLISPPGYRAVGASTAVFAALGLLAGFGWGQRLQLRDRRLYRWAPLFGGVCLLALLGSGGGPEVDGMGTGRHVDVAGHLLGFVAGLGCGWLFSRTGVIRSRHAGSQATLGLAAVALVAIAWLFALRR